MSSKGRSTTPIAMRPLSDVPLPLPGPSRRRRQGPGRPAVAVDWDEVGQYLRKGLPLRDIAALHRCSEATLRAHAASEGVDIQRLTEQKTAEGRDKLLDQLHHHAEKWGPAAIFLSKQTVGVGLGYRDAPPEETSNEAQEALRGISALCTAILGARQQPAIEGQARELPPATVEPDQGHE